MPLLHDADEVPRLSTSAAFSLRQAEHEGPVARATLVPDGAWALVAPAAALEPREAAS